MRLVFMLLLACALAPGPNAAAQEVTTVSDIVTENLDGSYNLFIYVTTVTGPQGAIPETNTFQGPLLSITNRGANMPFNTVVQTPLLQIYQTAPATPLDSVGETFSLFDGNVVTNIYVPLGPVFLTQPQSQSLFVGSNASFTVEAAHCTGYQWQMDGTNLIDDGHFSGVTNSTLEIASVTTNDSGSYSVIAENPNNSEAITNLLGVFEPIQLEVDTTNSPGFVHLVAGNADHTPLEPYRTNKLNFYFTTNLGLGLANWSLYPGAFLLTNGVLQGWVPTNGIVIEFWDVVEHQ